MYGIWDKQFEKFYPHSFCKTENLGKCLLQEFLYILKKPITEIREIYLNYSYDEGSGFLYPQIAKESLYLYKDLIDETKPIKQKKTKNKLIGTKRTRKKKEIKK